MASKMTSLLIVAGMALAACGGAESAPPAAPSPANQTAEDATPATGSEGEQAEAAPQKTPKGFDAPWAKLDRKQRMTIMKEQVMPALGPLFAQFAPEKYGDDEKSCMLCHGDAVMDGNFEMPSKSLPPLNFGDPEFAEYKKRHAAVFEFMSNEVVPKVAAILAVDPYSQDNPDGFGCFSCHPQGQ